MHTFLLRLERVGYHDGETLFAAPYDFRYSVAPPGHPSTVDDTFFARLKGLVERARRLNVWQPATIVSNSFGGTLLHQFLLWRPYRGAGGSSDASCQWRHRGEASSWACSCSSPVTTTTFHSSTQRR
jgi:hypothetical protein